MDGRYEKPEDLTRRKYQQRHFPTSKVVRGRENRIFQTDPFQVAFHPQTTYKTDYSIQAAKRLYASHSQLRSGLANERKICGVQPKVNCRQAKPPAAKTMRPAVTPIDSVKTIPFSPSSGVEYKEKLRRQIGALASMSLYKREFQPKDPSWPAITQVPDEDTRWQTIMPALLDAPPIISRSRNLVLPNQHATTYELAFEPPSTYSRERMAGNWDHERYHKGTRETKGHEHGWNKCRFLVRPAPWSKLETTYVDHYAGTHQLSKTMLSSPSNPPVWKRRHHAMFPRPSRELWGH